MYAAWRTCLVMRHRIKNLIRNRAKARCVVLLLSLMLSPYSAFVMQADTGGSISGTVTDQTGAVVPDTTVTALNLDTTVQQTTKTNANGFFTLTNLPVGRYEIEIIREGFKPYKRTGLAIDVNAALREDISLTMGEQSEEVVVSDTAVHVETESSQMGEVVTGARITAVALNGRSFTDLLALQPGIVPMSTQQPDSIVMAGASVAIAPSGLLNPGNQSISGQREDANGFVVNGGDVKELMNGGTSIVPDLDSIAEFRVLTNNFDAEYGNYSGGIVNVVTKSGTNGLHGSAFEFLRNTALDAKNYFSSERAKFNQNQFGGAAGGPIAKNKLFFFGDYQGTRTRQGIDTGLISVPSLQDRGVDQPNGSANFIDIAKPGNNSKAGAFTTTAPFNGQQVVVPTIVSGPNLAALLGSGVSPGEPYYFYAGEHEAGNPSATYPADCTSSPQCVFPGAIIPRSAWSSPAKSLLKYIPPVNSGASSFSTASEEQKLRDDKWSFRLDGNSGHWGMLSAYYFYDNFKLDNPYPTGQGGASVPGFNALNLGTSQLLNLGQTKTFGLSAVNEIHLSFMRSANTVGQPVGGVGIPLACQGFTTAVDETQKCPGSAFGATGIYPLAPSIEGVENIVFNSLVMGTPITNLAQVNNTYSVMDNFSKVLGNHTIKMGLNLSYEQVNVNPDATFNGSFQFVGSETGSDFADFLIGVASNYNQADSMSFYGRHKYASAFAQDTWRIKPSLTLNYGLRWELMRYWSEKYNQIPTFVLGEQSKVYPTAPVSLVYPGDPGVPNTLVPQRNRFAPRVGLAYSPGKANGILGKIIGGQGRTSIRAGYGIFYSVIQGNTIAIDEPQPPYGTSYTGQGVLFATPFKNAATGNAHANPFPVTFPPLNASADHPNSSINFSPFLPQAGMTAPPPGNTYPYAENYFLSIERQLNADTVLSFSYVGSEAHHLLLIYSANPGNPALCLALSQPSAVAPGTPTCGPLGENNVFTTSSGQTINGTRGPLGPNFANDDYDASIGNSNYNSFQADLRHSGKRLNFTAGYTFSKSIDQASSLSDIVNPFNFNATRALSAWDLKHSVVLTYTYQLPLERLTSRAKFLAQGWSLSGITRVSSGFPVTISEEGDNSLMGSQPNGVNNHSLDFPDFTPGPLNLNPRPRSDRFYFNPALFSPNALGTPGNASRRFFYGPPMFNTDLALLRSFRITEAKALQFRLETFNLFNHTQFFGPASVNGDFSSSLFGKVVKAMPPRLMQLALKYTF
jgi:Carboxypeptidase regulatory-like domain/TonB dependent receptor-like, beta-barrel